MSSVAIMFVAAGGAAGALCRGLLTRFLKKFFPGLFPFPTLIVNLLSCTAAGGCAALALDNLTYLLVMVGFLGGFSTLATLNYEAVTLFIAKRYGTCTAYLIASYVTTLAAAAIGFCVMRMLL